MTTASYFLKSIGQQYTFANVSSATVDSNLITAIANRKIRVLGFLFVCGSTATPITFNSKGSSSGTAISPQFQNAANGGACGVPNDLGWFETNLNEALTLTSGTGSTTGVLVIYQEI